MEWLARSNDSTISFSRWSRKSYAVFSSIGKTVRICVLSLSCSILVLTGHSLEKPDTLLLPDAIQLLELEEFEINAHPGPAVQSELMRLVEVITTAEIEQLPADNLPGILEKLSGVDIRRRGAFGMQADIGIRGGTFDQAMILLNGINITDPQTGHHNLNIAAGLQSLERIEVLHGAGARIFGPNAFSGAVNFVTHPGGSKPAVVSFEAGQFGFFSGSLSGGFSTGNTGHFFSANGMRSDGFTSNTDFAAAGIYYRATARFSNFDLDAQAAYSHKAFGANSFYSPLFPEQFEEIQTGFFSLKLIPKGKINLQPSVYWRGLHDRFELFRYDAPDWYNQHNYHFTNVAGASLKWVQPWQMGMSTFSFDYRMEQIFSTVLGDLLDKPRRARKYEDVFYSHYYLRNGISLFGEHSMYFGHLFVSAGAMAWLNTELPQGVSLFPGLDAGWQLNHNFRLFGSVSRTLRLPTFTDLFYSGPTNLGNAFLKPEKAVSAEAGLKGQFAQLNFEICIFRRWGKDMIDWIKLPGEERWKSLNLTEVNFSGIQTLVNIKPKAIPVEISAGYTYMNAGKSSGDFLSYYVLDFLNHKATLGFMIPVGRSAAVNLNIMYIDRNGAYMLYEDGEYSGLVEFPVMWPVDIKAFYQFRRMEIFAVVTNLLDQQSVSIANVPQMGRFVRTGIVLQLSKN